MSEVDKLLMLIENDPVIKRYRSLEVKMNASKDIKKRMGQLKTLQKQLINARHIGKEHAILQFEKAYDEQLKQIEEYPLMAEYLSLQEEINEMLQTVLQIIEDGLNKEIEQ